MKTNKLTKTNLRKLRKELDASRIIYFKQMEKELKEKGIEFLSDECFALYSYQEWREATDEVSILDYLLEEDNHVYDVYLND